jgi:ribosomal protein S27AE
MQSNKKKYSCKCGNGGFNLWWMTNWNVKIDSSDRRIHYNDGYKIYILNTAGNGKQAKFCPNCGIELPTNNEVLEKQITD